MVQLNLARKSPAIIVTTYLAYEAGMAQTTNLAGERLESNLNFRPGSEAEGGTDRQRQHKVRLLGERALSKVGMDSPGIKE